MRARMMAPPSRPAPRLTPVATRTRRESDSSRRRRPASRSLMVVISASAQEEHALGADGECDRRSDGDVLVDADAHAQTLAERFDDQVDAGPLVGALDHAARPAV